MADMVDVLTLAAVLVTACTAVLALFVGARQIRAVREMEAWKAYEKHHHLALQYRELSTGFDYASAGEGERRYYIYFVLATLMTMERVVMLFPRDAAWITAVLHDIDQHRAFLCSPDFLPYRAMIDRQVLELIDRECARPPVAPPPGRRD